MKVFNKEKVVLSKIIDVLESGRIEGLTDESSNIAHYNTIVNIIKEYKEGGKYYHRLDGILEEHIKKNYAHFNNNNYYTEVKEESETKENIIEHDVAQVIHEIYKNVCHINEGVGILVLNSAVGLIDRGNIKQDELMKILFEGLK